MSTASDRLQFYLDAERDILRGQSVRMGERTLTRADLAEVRRGIRELQRQVALETSVTTGVASGVKLADFSCR